MTFWFKVYMAEMLRMFTNPYYYILAATVLVGGRGPRGKVIATIGITILIPILKVLDEKLIQVRKRKAGL